MRNIFLILILLTTCTASQAQIPLTDEFQVNTYTTGQQLGPSVAAAADGSMIVVWTGINIQGQRFDSTGAPTGGEFQVDTYTSNTQNEAVVASDADGNFVVVWQSYGSFGTDNDENSIQGQRFDSLGTPIGGQFQVNLITTSFQQRPAVAMDADGDFVVLWTRRLGPSSSDVQGQLFDSTGSAVGVEFVANSYFQGGQGDVAVAMAPDGQFVAAWQSGGPDSDDASSSGVRARRFDSTGAAIGDAFQANAFTTGSQDEPTIAMDAAGDFIIVWHSSLSDGPDNSMSIRGRLFHSSGTPKTQEFQVNSYFTGRQNRAAVSSDVDGTFVVSWLSYDGSPGTDQDPPSVQAQLFDPGGQRIGDEFQVNTFTTGRQRLSASAFDAAGRFLVLWTSESGGTGTDDFYSIQARRFSTLSLLIFADGFETGDTSAWSLSEPP